MKLKYTDEETFITEEIEFSDEHYNIAKKLHNQYNSEICSPIMVKNDKQSLVFCVNIGNKNRVAYECGNNKYKIIIEKI